MSINTVKRLFLVLVLFLVIVLQLKLTNKVAISKTFIIELYSLKWVLSVSLTAPYKDLEREYVHTDAKKLKSDGIRELPLDKINDKEKAVIFKQLPKEFKGAAKDIQEPQNIIKDEIEE